MFKLISRLFLALSLLCLGCTMATDAQELRRWQGQFSTALKGEIEIANTQGQWRAIWQKTQLMGLPEFDPGKETGVAIFTGQHSTGGYSVRVLSMAPRDGRFVNEIEEVGPGPNDLTTQAISSPWLILTIAKQAFPVVVEPRFHAL